MEVIEFTDSHVSSCVMQLETCESVNDVTAHGGMQPQYVGFFCLFIGIVRKTNESQAYLSPGFMTL
jgi:hypothetical protein